MDTCQHCTCFKSIPFNITIEYCVIAFELSDAARQEKAADGLIADANNLVPTSQFGTCTKKQYFLVRLISMD